MFQDRNQAGILLSQKLTLLHINNGLILGITRGGIVVAKEIVNRLNFPMRTIVVKKIGAPLNPELALGAVTDNTTLIDWDLAKRVGANKSYVFREIKKKKNEAALLQKKFTGLEKISLKGKNIIIVDDGVATGATVEVVIKYLQKKKVKQVILAIPVIATDIYQKLKLRVDKLVSLKISSNFSAVGQFYQSFPQVTDEEIREIIKTLKI